MSTLDIKLDENGEPPTLHVGGTLDVQTAPQLAPHIDALVALALPHVVVDLAELDLIDSAGVAALVGLYKRVKAQGGEMRVVNAYDQPLAIFKLLRMDKVFLH